MASRHSLFSDMTQEARTSSKVLKTGDLSDRGYLSVGQFIKDRFARDRRDGLL
jgi:hypothetical protein